MIKKSVLLVACCAIFSAFASTKTVYFNFNGSNLTESDVAKISTIGNNGSVRSIRLDGYTDKIGNKHFNKTLSAKRNLSVKNQITKDKITNLSNIVSVAHGSNGSIVSSSCIFTYGKDRTQEIAYLKHHMKKHPKKKLLSRLRALEKKQKELLECTSLDRRVVVTETYTSNLVAESSQPTESASALIAPTVIHHESSYAKNTVILAPKIESKVYVKHKESMVAIPAVANLVESFEITKPHNNPYYVGVQAGFATNGDAPGVGNNNTHTSPRQDAAMRLDLGYDINKYFGVEFGANSANDLISIYDLSAKFMLPLMHNKLNLHAQVGGAYAISNPAVITITNSNISTASLGSNLIDFDGMAGIGADYYVTKNWSISANGYIYDTLNRSGIDNLGRTEMVLGGLAYHF